MLKIRHLTDLLKAYKKDFAVVQLLRVIDLARQGKRDEYYQIFLRFHKKDVIMREGNCPSFEGIHIILSI